MALFFESIQKLILNVIDWFYKPFSKLIPIVTFRYAATGGFNTAMDIILYFICYNFVLDQGNLNLGIVTISSHIAAFVLVFPVTFTSGFLLAKYITFTSSDLKGRVQLFRYIVIVAGSIILNYLFLKFFVEYCGFYPTIAKIITTAIVVFYSYFAQKFYTFKTPKVD